jgi:hypothetical protein
MEAISKHYSGTLETYMPDPGRAELHQERREKYQALMSLLLEHIY